MNKKLQLYQFLFLIVLSLYIYLGKGIAYGYFAELLMLGGCLLLIKEKRNIEIINIRSAKILYVFLFINLIYLCRGVFKYGFFDTLRDSFIFNYIFFSFILLLFLSQIQYFIKSIALIYKYYPLIIFILYILSLNNFLGSISLFGNIHLLFFKFGDISVHLFVSFIFQIVGLNKYKKPFDAVNLILIFLMFSIASSYSRGGMLSFIIAFFVFYKYSNSLNIKHQIRRYFKFLPLVLLFSVLFLSLFKGNQNFQGREVGISQVANNFTSIFITTDEEGALNDNKIWRLLWWGKIIDYTFNGPYFMTGKGLGLSLAEEDEILTTDLEGELRSPHNFNLTILARYGVFVFLLWIYWLIRQIKRLKQPILSNFNLILICVQVAFLFNASFDVFLEGPMGAFPFWVFVGVDLIFENFNYYSSNIEIALFEHSYNTIHE